MHEVQPLAEVNLPAAHTAGEHALWPTDAVAPEGQPAHEGAAAGEYVFAAQVVQDVAPVADAYFPGTQLVQREPPEVSLKVPAAQLVHALAFAPEYVPTGQVVQLDEPDWYAKAPARQLGHCVPPVVPR